jgi:hypothetical protein
MYYGLYRVKFFRFLYLELLCIFLILCIKQIESKMVCAMARFDVYKKEKSANKLMGSLSIITEM